ncbi:hypothetical protein DRI50_03175 [candidate division KSB1 bacterium]|nr:MAG: hypothetical protein DRI50_03175 [candidate division KSB1 bacterium]
MSKKTRLSMGIVLIVLFGWASGAFAQSQTPSAPFFTSEIIIIYFLMLLFATIINRLLEYLKLFLAMIDQKVGFFARIRDAVFNKVRRKMDRMGILYNPEKVRSNLKKYLIFAVMQFLAFGLGIVLAWLLKMDVLAQVQLNVGQPLGFILTGLIIGAGVDPVHSFFRIAQEKRKIKKLLAKI